MDALTHMSVKKLIIEGMVTRCTCSDEQRADLHWHGAHGAPCPNGRTEDLGVMVEKENHSFFEKIGIAVKDFFTTSHK